MPGGTVVPVPAQRPQTSSARSARFDFTGSTVLVTGGGSGIGAAIAAAFLGAGANVAVAGRRREPLESVVAGHPAERTAVISADLATSAQVDSLVAEVVARFGALDVVVANAGAYAGGAITEVDDAAWERMRSTNVDGTFYLARAAAPHLEASRGSLVAVSSVSGERGDWGQAGYNATKAAMTVLVRSLALDWGAAGVRANVVAPAMTATAMSGVSDVDDDALAPARERVALGRIGVPDDIAGAVLFLASDAAAYITGAVLPVDGGTSASTGQVR